MTRFPRGATELYLYAGEAGRRLNYARHLYSAERSVPSTNREGVR